MNRVEGRTILLSGATSGIGRASARALAALGAHLILVARRAERLQLLAQELQESHGTTVRIRALDVRDRRAVEEFAEELEREGASVDILINNAGLARGLHKLHEGRVEDWEEMIDTNVKGLLYLSRAVIPGMVARNRGHVVNIGSIAGHQVYPAGNVYNATKFAVRALNEGMNVDLVGTKVRVTSIDPGLVETEFSEVRFRGDTERAKGVYQGITPLAPEDIADAVCYVVNTPEHVDVLDLVILPTDQRSAYVLHREGEQI
jgi:serine 3-dehydrogenase